MTGLLWGDTMPDLGVGPHKIIVVVVVVVVVDIYYLMYIVVVLADFALAFSLQPQLYFLQNHAFRCRPSVAYGFGLQKQIIIFKKSSSHYWFYSNY